ncbi:hypothetical protein NKG05_23555 [Oerskovia sp. M15]
MLLGIGGGTDQELRRSGAALAGATRGLERVVSAATADATSRGVTAFVEGYLLAAYRTPRFGGTMSAARRADPSRPARRRRAARPARPRVRAADP